MGANNQQTVILSHDNQLPYLEDGSVKVTHSGLWSDKPYKTCIQLANEHEISPENN